MSLERTQQSYPISNRAQALLKQLVELYIKHGGPVGSKTLAQQSPNKLSSATIRKVMGDLEEKGYVHSPHTSAGRIPTSQGLRFFVDSLLTFHPLDQNQILDFQNQLDPSQTTKGLISTTSSLLSEITHMAGVVTLPKHEILTLKYVEFISLSENRVLVVLVVNEREVQNRIIITKKKYTASDLTQAGNFLMQHFVGRDLRQARNELIQALKRDKLHVDTLMDTILDMATQAFNPPSESNYVMAGEGKLVTHSQPQALEHLQKLFQAFSEKSEILHLLDVCLESDGVQMFIGEESGFEAFKNYSIVTSRYKINGKVVGVLGVIGPTRMPYGQVIPIVDITAKLLGTALNPDASSPFVNLE